MHGVRLGIEKGVYFATEVSFLERTINASGLRAISVAIAASCLKTPTTELELHDFVHGLGFFRGFIPQFATLMAPARTLLTLVQKERGSMRRKNLKERRSWSEDAALSLDRVAADMRRAMENQISLAFPDTRKQVFVLVKLVENTLVAIVPAAVEALLRRQLTGRYAPGP